MKQIELKNISKIYKTGEITVKALDNINLQIKKGDFIAIVGPSGSGKSTLMHIIGALSKPTCGTYKLEGEDLSKISQSKLAKIRKEKIGFVFQTFNLIPRISVLANVELPMIYKRSSSKNRRKRTLDLLNKIGLTKRINFRPNQLSGGEMQRVAIARSLANKPEVILADEPTGNIDSKNGKEIMNIFNTLNKERITIILVTHDKEIANYAKKIVHLKDGKIREENNVS